MADWYVTATAGGTGVGSEVDPFTLAQAEAKADYAVNDNVYIKSGTYEVTSAVTWVDSHVNIIGYNTVIGDLDTVWGESTKPVIYAGLGAGIANVFTCSSDGSVRNIVVDAVNATGNAITAGGNSGQYNCVGKNATSNNKWGIVGFSAFCIADGCYGGMWGNSSYCLAKNCSYYGFYSSGQVAFSIAYNCTVKGFTAQSSGVLFSNCSASLCGIGFYGIRSGIFSNCIAEDCTTYSYATTSGNCPVVVNCNSWNPGTADVQYIPDSTIINLNNLDPALVDPANDDYSLGNTNLYGLGAYVGSLDGTGTLDFGAIQKASGVGDLPSVTDVRLGVVYGAGTGSLDLPVISDVKTGVDYDNTTKTGTYDGSDRWTDPDEDNVKDGVEYKANSLTNNKTGNVTLPAEDNVKDSIQYGTDGTEYTGSLTSTDPGVANVLSGTTYKIENVDKTGSFDETTRNTDPGVNNVIKDITYKIINIEKTGTFDEASRNTDPAVSNVLKDVTYKILNVEKTGTYAVSGVPVITNIVCSDYTPTTLEAIEITADITNSPDYVDCTINGILKKMTLKTGTTYTTGLVQARYFGICEDQPIVVTATNANGGSQASG